MRKYYISSDRLWVFLVLLGLIVLVALGIASGQGHPQEPTDMSMWDVIELKKSDALELQDLNFKAVMAQADLEEFITVLQYKYGVTMNTHNLVINRGRFQLREFGALPQENLDVE